MIPTTAYSRVCFLDVCLLVLAANVIWFSIIDKINSRLPEEQQFSWFGSYLTKNMRIARTYKQLFPGSWRRWACRLCMAAALILLMLAAHFDK